MRMLDKMPIIDLRFSKLKLPEDPKEAEAAKKRMYETCHFVFERKAYADYYDRTRRSPYFFSWCRYDRRSEFRDLFEWKTEGWTEIQRGEDPFWPEGCPPNEKGHFTSGDLIAVKRPLLDHIQEQLEQQAQSRGGARERLEKFHQARKAQGGAIPEAMFQELLGNLPSS